MTKFINKILVNQALPIANFTISNVFPVVNVPITLYKTSEDDDSFLWSLNDSENETTNNTDSEIALTLANAGVIPQTLQAFNTSGEDSISKNVYPLEELVMAYIVPTISTKVARVGESVQINFTDLYDFEGENTLSLDVINHITGEIVQSVSGFLVSHTVAIALNETGIYDIEAHSTVGDITISNKQEMLLTVTPALADRENAIDVILDPEWTNIDGSDYDGGTIAAGSTIVISKSGTDPDSTWYRLRLSNLIGTEENPIIVTIDESEQFEFNFSSWYGINISGCEHVVIDGRGYQNIENGIHVFKDEDQDTGVICIQGGDFSTNVEIHNVECSKCTFAGIVFKTDPDTDDPTTWRYDETDNPDGFICNDFKLHNSYLHNTSGEGIYIGYYDSGTHETDEGVEYRAHKMVDTKIYRNDFYRCGWDSLQLNNAYGATEIKFNYIVDSAWLGETDQNTGMSLSMEGEVAYNEIRGCSGLPIQILCFSETSIYNNIIDGGTYDVSGILLMGGSGTVPETIEGGSDSSDWYNTIPINIYNNTIIVQGAGNIVTMHNIVQWLGMVLKNNLVNHAGDRFGNAQDATITEWEANEASNINIVDSDESTLMIADVEQDDFRIYDVSPLAIGGELLEPLYDIRGFKCWYDDSKHVGAYSGIISS